jgi:hypothetical protein
LTWEDAVKEKPQWPDDLDVGAVEAFNEAYRMAPGQERVDALQRANLLRSAATTYGWLFSKELTAPN